MSKSLYVAFYGDNAVYGASDSPHCWKGSEVENDPDFAIVLYHNVPPVLAAALEAQGTSAQEFSDGYKAQNALASLDLESEEIWANDPADYVYCEACGRSTEKETWKWDKGCACGYSDPALAPVRCPECGEKHDQDVWQENKGCDWCGYTLPTPEEAKGN